MVEFYFTVEYKSYKYTLNVHIDIFIGKIILT